MKRLLIFIVAIGALFPSTLAHSSAEDESPIIYFVMIDRFDNGDPTNDQGGLTGDRSRTAFDPRDPGFFHGGDLAGLTSRLDYIESLGFTAIWITPVARQVPVSPGGESAAYHGYWGAGFDEVDPRFGTMEEMKRFVRSAHERGLKVFLDVVVNHTGDLISYKEGGSYLSLKENPYKTSDGKKFDSSKVANSDKFPSIAQLDTVISFPKTVSVNTDIRKSPEWLNDPRNYHNRGEFSSSGEASTYGDFYGLDDLFTESPLVSNGWIEVFSEWIKEVGIDGFRLDTFKHVNSEFWQDFLPAMRKVAADQGKSYFPMWGEIYDSDPGRIAEWIKRSALSEALDFPVQNAIAGYVIEESARALAETFDGDDLYITPVSDASKNGTFLGNHDMGRIGGFIYNRYKDPETSLKKLEIAHALLFALRGNPIVYYGDEFGLIGGRDKAARQSLFPTEVREWQSQPRIGMEEIGTRSSFDIKHPMQTALRELSEIRKRYPELKDGFQEFSFAKDGLLGVTRRAGNRELLFVFNSGMKRAEWKLKDFRGFERERGDALINESTVSAPALSWSFFSRQVLESRESSKVSLLQPKKYVYDPSILFLRAQVREMKYARVRFEYREGGGPWINLGIDTSPIFAKNIYRVAPPLDSLPQTALKQGKIRLRAVAISPEGLEVRSKAILLRLTK